MIHKTGENGDYANIETIIPMVGKKPPAVKPVVFDLDDACTYPTFQTLPQYIQEGIAKSEGFEFTGLTVAPKNNQTQPPLPGDSCAPPAQTGGMYPPVAVRLSSRHRKSPMRMMSVWKHWSAMIRTAWPSILPG